MAHGNERARLLAAHDSRDARAGEHVSLRGRAVRDHREGVRMHEDPALGNRLAFGVGLCRYVHHAHDAFLVDMA